MIMGMLQTIVRSISIAVLFFVVLFVGEMIFPGTMRGATFSNVGLVLILFAVGLDAFFNLQSLD